MKKSDRSASHPALKATDAANIAQSLTPIEPESDRASLLKARILKGARELKRESETPSQAPQEPASMRTVATAQREWNRFTPGVEICVLHEDKQHRTALFRMQPGSVLFPHFHDMSEESFLLEGSAVIGDETVLTVGDYQFAAAGTEHPVINSPSGCIVLVRGERRPRVQVNATLLARMVCYFGESAGK